MAALLQRLLEAPTHSEWEDLSLQELLELLEAAQQEAPAADAPKETPEGSTET